MWESGGYRGHALPPPDTEETFGSGLLRTLCFALSSLIGASSRPYHNAHLSAERNSASERYARFRRLGREADDVLPCGLTRQQVRILEGRDITPEDHELLLTLDQWQQVKRSGLRSDQLSSAISATTIVRRQTCSICLEMVEPWQRVAKVRACSHLFHRKCITKWLTDGRDSCPLCGAASGAHK